MQGPCASRVAVRTTLILYGNDHAAGERVVIKRGQPTIKTRQKAISDARLLINCERLLIVGEQRSISEGPLC